MPLSYNGPVGTWLPPVLFLLFVLFAEACAGGRAPAPATVPATVPATPPASPTAAGAPTTSSNICIESIEIRDGKIARPRLVVKAPCAVLFTNRDDAVVQIQGHDFLLGEMGKDQSWAHTYRDPGQFEYFNAKDPSLRGAVLVQ